MNALAILNNFEREFAKPFWNNSWLSEDQAYAHEAYQNNFSSVFKYDEKKAAWNLTVELAGVSKEHLKLDTLDGFIQVSGEKTRGLRPGKFEARYQLPKGVDTEKIEATFEDGILSLEIPMLEKKPSKTITIK